MIFPGSCNYRITNNQKDIKGVKNTGWNKPFHQVSFMIPCYSILNYQEIRDRFKYEEYDIGIQVCNIEK